MADDFISGTVVDGGTAVENAVVIAIKQPDPSSLSQSEATQVEGIAVLTDANGDYEFAATDLFDGEHDYHVVAHHDDTA